MSYIEYLLFRILVFIVAILPMRALYLLSSFGAFLLQHVFGYRKETVQENLKNSFPEKSDEELAAITRKFYGNLCDVAIESIKGYTYNPEKLGRRYRFINIEVANRYFENGQNVIIAGSHYCNWEWAPQVAWLYFRHELWSFYKPISNKYIDRYTNNQRKRCKVEMISAYKPTSVLRQKAEKARAFVFISDQYPGNLKNAIWVNFLNQETPCLRGIEEYARIFKMPVLYADVKRIRRGYYDVVLLEMSPTPQSEPQGEITKRFMEILEKIIREKPEDWLWSHKRWKHRRLGIKAPLEPLPLR